MPYIYSEGKESDIGGGASKSSEVVKVGEFNQSSLTDDSFSVINLRVPSGFGGASVVLVVMGLGLVGYGMAKWLHRHKTAARRAVTSLELQKSPT